MFEEKQYFYKNKFSWILPIVYIFVVVINFIVPPGNMIITIFTVGFISLIMITIYIMNLYTRIDEEGIHYKLFPFILKEKTITWKEMKNIYVREYSPIGEYGGWGLRGLGSNRALNIYGNIGIQIEFLNGDKLLIGTNKKEEADIAINKYCKIL
jgi:hypothetical protein